MEYKFFYVDSKTKPDVIAKKRKEGFRIVDKRFEPKKETKK